MLGTIQTPDGYLRTDFCSLCRELVATDHPMGLCNKCAIRVQENNKKQKAWNQTHKSIKRLVRGGQVVAVISAIIVTFCLIYIFQPAIQQIENHPLVLIALLVFSFVGITGFAVAREIKLKIFNQNEKSKPTSPSQPAPQSRTQL